MDIKNIWNSSDSDFVPCLSLRTVYAFIPIHLSSLLFCSMNDSRWEWVMIVFREWKESEMEKEARRKRLLDPLRTQEWVSSHTEAITIILSNAMHDDENITRRYYSISFQRKLKLREKNRNGWARGTKLTIRHSRCFKLCHITAYTHVCHLKSLLVIFFFLLNCITAPKAKMRTQLNVIQSKTATK